ncbi:MAG: hypothetical protein WCO04_15805 [Pseudomonadota bacterium]
MHKFIKYLKIIPGLVPLKRGFFELLRRRREKKHFALSESFSLSGPKSAELRGFLANFRGNYVSCDLIRIGGDSDGGYLLPDILSAVKYCFSPGVGDIAKFEEELDRLYGIKSFLADASVEASPIVSSNFEFTKKFLGPKTYGQFINLEDWVHESIPNSDEPKILQMDIEGDEYSVLLSARAEMLASFEILVIEFHEVQRLIEPDFLRKFVSIFDKIFENFSVCHVHPNNCCGMALVDGDAVPRAMGIPRVMEVTFVRNDLITKCRNSAKVHLPHILDRKNVQAHPDLTMPEIWWKL